MVAHTKEEVKSPDNDFQEPPELTEAEAKYLYNRLTSKHSTICDLSYQKHKAAADFRRITLRLFEGKGYRYIVNPKTEKPFATIEELANEVFDYSRVHVQEMLRAARTEREMYCFSYIGERFSDQETPTVYVLETLRKNVNCAENRVHVFFHAKAEAQKRKSKKYPTGKDILEAADFLKLLTRTDEIYSTYSINNKFHLDFKSNIQQADTNTLLYLRQLIDNRLDTSE